MPENPLTKILAGQTEILLKNMLAVVQDANLKAELDGINASRFIFHTLHSLDKWFINPAEYKILRRNSRIPKHHFKLQAGIFRRRSCDSA